MIIHEGAAFRKKLQKLPLTIQKKYQKQIGFLKQDLFYPSLWAKKVQGLENVWEIRIDYHYRCTLQIEEEHIYLLTIGPHDKGLGKK